MRCCKMGSVLFATINTLFIMVDDKDGQNSIIQEHISFILMGVKRSKGVWEEMMKNTSLAKVEFTEMYHQ